MAFDVTAMDPKMLDVVGITPNTAIAVVALSGGAGSVKFPGFTKIQFAVAHSQSANAARASAISGNEVTLAGTGSDVVMVMVAGEVRR